ncbi:MAG: hypothetical protein ABF370_12400 [Verrucomicrobiales bacterium]|nr:hypothetical protein [Verrucomicrobiaceae bacterium]
METSIDLRTWPPAPTSELTEQPLGTMRWSANDPTTPQLFTQLVISAP